MGHSWTEGTRGVSAKIDLAGQTFGRLTVTGEWGRRSRKILWSCRCACGKDHVVSGTHLRTGHSRSCGCLATERKSQRAKHGMTGSRIYNIWQNMRQRTSNPKTHNYPRYGGRGIKLCEQWQTFEGFYADMGPTYADGLSIDRIDNDGNYEPGNCRWVAVDEQNRNRRSNRRIEFRGRTLSAIEWDEVLGLSPGLVANRLRRSWSVERALTEGVSPERLAAL